MSELTIERLASYKPRLVVHWCPSCDVHFSDVVTGRDAKTLPFEVTDAPAFLAALSRRGHIPWRQAVTGRVALHCHRGRAGHASGQQRARADQDHVSHLVSQIPGLQFLGAVTAPAEFDYDCGPSSMRVERVHWLTSRAEQLAAVRHLQANTLVTVSHACQREWCDVTNDTLTVRNYISLVAEALGCPRSYESDSLGRLKRTGDPATVIQSTQANWASHGLSKEQVEELVQKYDWSTLAPRSSAP